jgi:hypothetical protein
MRRAFRDPKACSYNAFVPGADYKTVHCFFVYKDDDPRGNQRKYQGLHEAVYRYNLYYLHRTEDGTWMAADGSVAKDLPVNKPSADMHARIFDSGDEFTAPTRIVVDEKNQIYLRYRIGVTDWKRGEVFVPYRHRFTTHDRFKWSFHDEVPSSWSQDVQRLLMTPGPAAFGGAQPNPWFIHYVMGPKEDPTSTYIWLGHVDSGYAVRPDGPTPPPSD